MTRWRVDVRLDDSKPEQAALLDYIEGWKADRVYSRKVRNGLRLIADLDAGNMDVLLELYPLVFKTWLENAGLSVGSPGVRMGVETINLDEKTVKKQVSESIEDAQERLQISNSWLFEE